MADQDQEDQQQKMFQSIYTFISNKINTTQQSIPTMLNNFIEYYVLIRADPPNTTYSNFFSNTDYEIKNNMRDIERISEYLHNILINQSNTLTKSGNKIVVEKKVFNLLQNDYNNLKNKINGSTELASNYQDILNQIFYKQIILVIGIHLLLLSIYKTYNE